MTAAWIVDVWEPRDGTPRDAKHGALCRRSLRATSERDGRCKCGCARRRPNHGLTAANDKRLRSVLSLSFIVSEAGAGGREGR